MYKINTISCFKKKEIEKGFHEAVKSKKSDKMLRFFNLGEANQWYKILDKTIEQKIRKVFSNEMKELNYIK